MSTMFYRGIAKDSLGLPVTAHEAFIRVVNEEHDLIAMLDANHAGLSPRGLTTKDSFVEVGEVAYGDEAYATALALLNDRGDDAANDPAYCLTLMDSDGKEAGYFFFGVSDA